MKRNLVKIILSLSTIIISSLLLFVVDLWHRNLPLISPVDLIENLTPLNSILGTKEKDKVVFGFFPYWNIKEARNLHIKELTHFAYFGIDFNPDGSIKKFDQPGELEPGWNQLDNNELLLLRRQLKILNKKFILVIRGMENDLIESIVNDPEAAELAANNIVSTAQENQFDGINIDFEYVGSPNQKTKSNFVEFVNKVSSKCKISNPNCDMSIDILADTAAKDRLHILEEVSPLVDHVIVMTYDFYRPSSTQAGPVSPLRGKCSPTVKDPCLEYDVVTSVSDITKKVPPTKLVLGFPFYGYEWQVASPNFLANTYPKTGGTATYKRIQALILNPPNPNTFASSWSDLSQTPFITYEEDGEIFQIQYENTLSLRLKLDLIHQANLEGLAIWALGYETPYTDLWETIARFL